MRLGSNWLIERASGLSTSLLIFLFLPGLGVFSASAQSIRTKTISDDGVTAVVEFEFDWRTPLQASVDSSGVQAWDQRALRKFTAGFDETSLMVEAGSLEIPIVTVLSSDFDEVRIPLSDATALPKQERPGIEVVGAGMHRKAPVVTLVARFYNLDENSGTLRRYRRLRVSITRRSPVQNRFLPTATPSNPHVLVTQSVLADGTIFKVRITEEGIYRIDRALLAGLGLTPDSIDPNNVQIFGNGGAPLPAENDAFRYADLAENPVFTRGGGDGSFNDGDVLLFYAAGPRGWFYTGLNWAHYVHPFSNENVYFIKIGSTTGKRIETVPHPGFADATTFTSTTGRHFRDIEEFVWSREHGSGYDWMSRTIRTGGSRPIFENVKVPGLLGGTISYQARVAIASNPRATVAFESNDVILGQLTAPRITINGSEFPSASPGEITFTQTVSTGRPLNLSMTLLNQVNEPEAAVDWVRVTYEQDLVAIDGYVRFASVPGAEGRQAYQIRDFSGTPFVWDVTMPGLVQSQGVSPVGGSFEFQIEPLPDDAPREYVAFTESAAQSLSSDLFTPVTNQNLHSLTSFPDLVIITPAEFLSAANRLADHRRLDGLVVLVSEIDQVYNEFSGGVPDMRAIRDYFKFLYDRAPDEESLLRYALLLGDGHYDFRGLSGLENQEGNWIFPFETAESLNTDASYTSDDYFALLDDNEGAWTYTTFAAVSDERMDIGVGRLTVQSLAQAEMVVDKIIRYEDPDTFGAWRARYVAVADDGPTGLSGTQDDGDLHMQNIDQVVELIRGGLYPQIDVNKIYAESFERVFQNGFKIPGAKQEINEALNQGTLVFNYSGHGGPDGLAQEEIFTKADAEQLTNTDKLALFITATCSFGWWDMEDDVSGGEALLLNDEGGSVALFTTVRLVYTSGDTTSLNAGLNRALNIQLFRADDEGKARRLGDVMRLTKNTNVGLQGNSRKLNLLGDPSMRLGLPGNETVVDALNQVPLDMATAQMKALDLVEITGHVKNGDGSVNSVFNGTASVTVFDAERKVPLIKQIRMPTPYYTIREDLIWRGDVEVQSGQFSARFVVPKDISYSNEVGRITVYASSGVADALGYSENFLVGGTSDSPPNDVIGPEMELFLGDTTFVSGGVVPASPELIVRLYDQSGVNTVGAGVGHEMLLVVDGEENTARDISSGFVAEKNSYQRGEVRWRLSTTEPGPHVLSVKAWDVLNNSSLAELSFLVANDEVLTVRNVYNYPNPMNRETRFVFEHNQPTGTPARVQIRIYTLNGRPIRTIDTEEALPEAVLTGSSVQIPWNGLDDDFDRLATGIYLYKLRVEVEKSDGATEVSEHIEKLAIIR